MQGCSLSTAALALTWTHLCVQASGNVAGLCSWAQAMVTYHKVAVDVEPKIVAARSAEGELRAATKEKDAALSQLAEVQAKLDDMQACCCCPKPCHTSSAWLGFTASQQGLAVVACNNATSHAAGHVAVAVLQQKSSAGSPACRHCTPDVRLA